MKRWIKAISGAVVVCMVLSLCGFAGNCAEVRESVVRVHILANSDSAEDQTLKLKVRDAVIEAGAGVLDGVTDRTQAEDRLKEALPRLIQTAQQCVYDEGFSYPVTAELTTMYFTTRTYDSGTFPAGRYRAVRFSIGKAEGKNWWCVMYPPLCVSAATDKASLADVVDNDANTIVSDAPRYAVRFKIVEWFEALSNWITRG